MLTSKKELHLCGGVDEHMAREVLEALLMRPKELTIYLNTEGGDTYHMFEICDMLTNCEATVTIIAYGVCMSAGIWILNSADIRIATPECFFMIHHGEETVDNTQLKKHHARMFRKMKNMLADRLTVSRATLGKYFSKEHYMTAEDALRIGLVDDIRSLPL